MSLGLGGTVVARARAVLEADTRLLDAGLAKSEARFAKFNKVAVSASLAVAVAFGEGAKKSIEAATRYQTAMELIHTQAGKSRAEVNAMKKALLDLAPAVATGPEELAAGLYHVESAGLQGKKALDVLSAAAKGAKLGQADLEDVTNALNAVVVSGVKGVKNYDAAMGSLNATVGAGDMRMQDLADAMGTGLAAKGKIFGLTLNDMNAALAVFGDNNIRGAEAGTLLASAIRLLGAPSKTAQKALEKIHVTQTELADDMRKGGLPTALADLKKKMEDAGLTASQQAALLSRAFGGRQAGGIMLLIGQLSRLHQKEEEVTEGSKRFGKDWEAYSKTSQFATEQFHATVQKLEIEVGNKLLPAFTKIVREGTSFLQWTDRNSKVAKIAAGVIGGFAVAVLGLNAAWKAYKLTAQAVMVVQSALNAVMAAMAANPVLLAVAALVALGVALVVAYKKSETFRNIVNAAFEKVRAVVGAVVNFIREHWRALIVLIPLIGLPLALAAKHFGTLKNGAKSALGVVISFVHMFRDAVMDMWDKVAGPLNKVIGFFSRAVGWASKGKSLIGKAIGSLGDGIVGASNAAGAAPAGRAPRKDVTPGLWDELAIAEAAGLHVTSTYRPGAVTASGNASLHGMYPSHAFDSTDGTNSGWASARMHAVFESFVGRPGVSEVILSPYWWHPGSGIGRITNSAIMAQHWSHVHVGTVSGDGVVGRGGTGGGGFFTGDGLAPAKRKPKALPKRAKAKPHKEAKLPKWKGLVARFSKSKTGETVIDGMVAKYDALDQDRQNAEREYSVTEDELALNDPAGFTVTKTAVDPVTGLEYEYDEVDYAAVAQEAGDEDRLIDLQNQIRKIVVAMKALAEKIRDSIGSTIEKLKKGISSASKSAASEAKLRDRYLREASTSAGRIERLKEQLTKIRRGKKPSKTLIYEIEDQIAAETKRMNAAKAEASVYDKASGQYAKTAKDLGEREKNVEGAQSEWNQKPVDLGFDIREIDVQLAKLGQEKAGILGTTAEPFNLDKFRADNAGGDMSAPAASADEIAAQLATERDAIVAARGRFVSDFGSDVFAPTGGGGMGRGAAAPRNVQVVQNFTTPPEDPFVWLKKSEFAASAVFGS